MSARLSVACLALVPPLWPDVPPAPLRRPSPRTVAPRPSPPPGPGGQAIPFPAARAVAPPPVVAPWEQLALPLARPLPLFPDLYAATGGLCLAQHDDCAEADCRHHLGGLRPLGGSVFGCALAVATAYPHGLPPVTVAALLGLDEGTVQRTERAAYGRYRLALQREKEAQRALLDRRRATPRRGSVG